jgi:hypothetical protein
VPLKTVGEQIDRRPTVTFEHIVESRDWSQPGLAVLQIGETKEFRVWTDELPAAA